MRSATVPLGWIIGCPLLGFISDRLGRRKPVIVAGAVVLLACLAWILYGRAAILPPYVLGIVAGIASGAAMLPYTVIKEANPPEVQRHSHRSHQFPELHLQRPAGTGLRMGSGECPAGRVNSLCNITRRLSSHCYTESRWQSFLRFS